MFLHYWYSNAILAEPLKSRADSYLLRAITALYKHITHRGLQMRLHILDNKWSAGMKISIWSVGSQHQLVQPGLYFTLISDRSIQTFKHHLITVLSNCNRKLPLHLWCRLIQQVVLTLNILCPETIKSVPISWSLPKRSLWFYSNTYGSPCN